MRSQKQEKVTWSVKSGCLGIGHCAPNSTNYPSHPCQVNERRELNAEQPSSKRGGGGWWRGNSTFLTVRKCGQYQTNVFKRLFHYQEAVIYILREPTLARPNYS